MEESMITEINEASNYEMAEKAIWNPKYFVIFAALGSFLVLIPFYIINCNRLNEKKMRNEFIPLALVGIAGIVGIVTLIPSAAFARSLSVGISIGIGYYLNTKQGPLYEEHIKHGGKSASYVWPVLLLIIISGIVIVLAIMSVNIPDNYKDFGNGEVYYTDNVTSEEVDSLGNYLLAIGYFSESGNDISVKLDKLKGEYIVSFVIMEEYATDPELIETFTYAREDFELNLYPGSNVVVVLADGSFNVLQEIR